MKNKHTRRRSGEARRKEGEWSDSLKYVVRISFICSSSASAESHLARVSSALTTRQLQWSKNLSWLKPSVVISKRHIEPSVLWLSFHKLSRHSSSTFAPMRCERASERTKTGDVEGAECSPWRHPSTPTCKYFSVDSKMRNHIKRFFLIIAADEEGKQEILRRLSRKLNGILWVMIFFEGKKVFSCRGENLFDLWPINHQFSSCQQTFFLLSSKRWTFVMSYRLRRCRCKRTEISSSLKWGNV